jgi:hypothetical protein
MIQGQEIEPHQMAPRKPPLFTPVIAIAEPLDEVSFIRILIEIHATKSQNHRCRRFVVGSFD